LEDNQALKKSSVDGLAATQEELARCLEKIETLGEVDQTKFQQLSRQIVDKNTEFETSQKTMNEVQRKIGGLQERVEHQQQILKKMEVLKEQRVKLDQERRIEKELMNAFGKTGIQALILENSAIEIEKIANDLLTKLTNGSINIKIQTQRANQDGSLREVFDIIVTDEYHSSPFNMYSGGEKFRIAFVVRVALSILLSRRAGVRVGAIFYDEAFQDLDDDGIDKMVEVFKLLSADFRYQLVISHTSELKNQFRDVLVVNKTSAGSFVSKR
jgi:exonuclease SbcC